MAQPRQTARRKVSNLMALSLLSLLTERPMYPYEMASKLREYGKDQAIKINWGSLYTVVQNLEKHGFIEAVEVAREGRQPERTTYGITEAGRAELKDCCASCSASPGGSTPGSRRRWENAASWGPTSWPACCGSGSGRWKRLPPCIRKCWMRWRPSCPGSS
jgi:DNA-binding PadR family transcriptional regulator